MKTIGTIFLIVFSLTLMNGKTVRAQENTWSLDECINYALENNIQIQKAGLTTDRSRLSAAQAKYNRLPSVNGSVRQNFSWGKSIDVQTGDYSSFSGSNSTNYSVSSSMVLFNSNKLNNQIEQANLDMESSVYSVETIKESISLGVLDAFLTVLYAHESVTNSQKQIDASNEQLALAAERLEQGFISTSDYLQIKSQLATEKLTLANAINNLTLSKVNLMQLMEFPVADDFEIEAPDLDDLLNEVGIPSAADVYATALEIKPQVKNAGLSTEATKLDVEIARADLFPSLSLDAGLSTGYMDSDNHKYFSQLSNKFSPSVGLTLSIPIFQKNQVKTSISLAEIAVTDAELNEIDTKNQLRKEIEQAVNDARAARIRYLASLESYNSQLESNQVAEEKFEVGLLNSVDFLFEKTNLITAESELLQSKFNMIFSYKVVDFYMGVPIKL